MNSPTMDYCDSNHSDRQMFKMRPRTPPMPPISRRSRSRSRSPRRRYRSPLLQHSPAFRSRDRQIDSFNDHNRNSANLRARPYESRCIGIFGLNERTTETDVRRIFSKFGHIEKTTLVMDNKTRRSRGYCFIYFESLKSAIRAVESSYHLRIDNRSVRVDYSITNHPRSPGTYERYKEEINRNYDNSRHRSYRRAHSPSPRRYHR